MTSFNIERHTVTGEQVVEIFDGGRLLATVYPHLDGIHIVSKHFAEDPIKPSVGMLPVPGYTVKFKS